MLRLVTRSRTWRLGAAVVAAAAVSGGLSSPASAFVSGYAAYDGRYAAAHSWVYEGARHTYRQNMAYYPGSAVFEMCAVLKGFYDRVNYAGPYCTTSQVKPTVLYTGGERYMDAGVGNKDSITRHVYGCASTSITEGYPC